MTRSVSPKRSAKPSRPAYVLEEQIGFILRQVWQRHATIFAREIGINLTPTQWAALAKLTETGPCSQNQLGRLTAMDVATIKGVIDRLTARGLTETSADPEDGRRLLVSLTRAGQQMAEKAAPNALDDHQGDAGAARCQGARDAGGAAEQAAVTKGPRQFDPTGKSRKILSSPATKNILLFRTAKSAIHLCPSPPTQRGVRGRHERRVRDAMDAGWCFGREHHSRMAKSCGPDTLTPVSSWRRQIARRRWQQSGAHRGDRV